MFRQNITTYDLFDSIEEGYIIRQDFSIVASYRNQSNCKTLGYKCAPFLTETLKKEILLQDIVVSKSTAYVGSAKMLLGLIAVVFEYGYFGTTSTLVQQPHKLDDTFVKPKCFNLTFEEIHYSDECSNKLNLFCSEYTQGKKHIHPKYSEQLMGAKISTDQALEISDWFLPEIFTGFYDENNSLISYPFLEDMFGTSYDKYSNTH